MTQTCLITQLRTQFAGPHWPHFECISATDNQYLIDLYIGGDMHWLTGHFPQQPVVAGVVQTHWAGEIAKSLFATGDEFMRIDNLKFQQVILPGQALQLSLSYSDSGASSAIKFCYRQGENIFSEGKFVFNQPQ